MSRKTPDSDDLMPEVLELLKRETEMKTQSITGYMRLWIMKNGLDDRDRSISWALNRLEKEGYVANPRRGIWRIAEKGLRHTLTSEESREIMERCTQQERAARTSKRARR
jgi:hypothetical protein